MASASAKIQILENGDLQDAFQFVWKRIPRELVEEVRFLQRTNQWEIVGKNGYTILIDSQKKVNLTNQKKIDLWFQLPVEQDKLLESLSENFPSAEEPEDDYGKEKAELEDDDGKDNSMLGEAVGIDPEIANMIVEYLQETKIPSDPCVLAVFSAEMAKQSLRVDVPEGGYAIRFLRSSAYMNQAHRDRAIATWERGFLPTEVIKSDGCCFYAIPRKSN